MVMKIPNKPKQGSLDQNAGESAVQSMDGVKDDTCVDFLPVAH